MTPELDEKLCKDFPLLYKDRRSPMNRTAMCWGFDTGDGWYKLIYDLSAKLEPLIAALPDDDCECGHNESEHKGWMGEVRCKGVWEWDSEVVKCSCAEWSDNRPRASQVKEKFGTLRFYMTCETDEMDKLIQEAEHLSAVTCEECGEPGELRGTSWLTTLCDSCSTKR